MGRLKVWPIGARFIIDGKALVEAETAEEAVELGRHLPFSRFRDLTVVQAKCAWGEGPSLGNAPEQLPLPFDSEAEVR